MKGEPEFLDTNLGHKSSFSKKSVKENKTVLDNANNEIKKKITRLSKLVYWIWTTTPVKCYTRGRKKRG